MFLPQMSQHLLLSPDVFITPIGIISSKVTIKRRMQRDINILVHYKAGPLDLSFWSSFTIMHTW